MTATHWTKFFWSDWEADESLRQCSLAAQGLWMRMLCICVRSEPMGYLTISGNALDVKAVARVASVPETEAESLMEELENWGVFSRDKKGKIFSRRLVRDAAKSKKAQENGEKGGNPTLCNNRKNDSPVKGQDKTHMPRAKSQEPIKEKIIKKKGELCPEDFLPNKTTYDWAVAEGFTDSQIKTRIAMMIDWSRSVAGSKGLKKDWNATFRNWLRKDIKDNGHPKRHRDYDGRPDKNQLAG